MKKILLVVGLFTLVGGAVGLYQYNKPHRDVTTEKPAFNVEAQSLLSDFQNKFDEAWAKYGDQTIEISGTILSIENASEHKYIALEVGDLMGGVICYIDPSVAQLECKTGEAVTVKGKVNGYDPDILQEVELKQCTITK
ncbi:MAG: hypothetical protein JXQ87_17260 [Bacteroidia bacterium]